MNMAHIKLLSSFSHSKLVASYKGYMRYLIKPQTRFTLSSTDQNLI